MKKVIFLIFALFVSGCASNFLVNQARNALHYEAITQLPQEDIIDQQAYVGGQITSIDRSKRQIELVKRHINNSGYPEEGTNNFDQRIFVTFAPSAKINFIDIASGDRIAVLGKIISFQKANIAGNEMEILHVEVGGDNFRYWSSFEHNRWDDDPFPWTPYHRHWHRRGFYY